MTSVAISETITTIAEAEKRFNLHRSPSKDFFTEWTSLLSKISDSDQTEIDIFWNRYIYHRSGGHLLENTVMLLLVSPSLTIAGFYDPPFRIKAEESVRITVSDSEETLQGRIDLLILCDRLWVIVLESKKTMLSVWCAVPQALSYAMANPNKDHPIFAMLSNGDDILFIKIQNKEYAFSRIFSPFSSKIDLENSLQTLCQINQIVQ